MSNVRYIPIDQPSKDQSYLFRVDIEQRADRMWVAWIAVLPGCAAYGYTRDEALEAVRHAARTYLREFIQKKVAVPGGIEVVDAPVIAVTM